MRVDKIRKLLNENTLVFDSPSFDKSIIGLTFDGRAIYELHRMANELSEDDKISQEDALEFIEYNTVRSLPYVGSSAPLILEDTYYIDYENE